MWNANLGTPAALGSALTVPVRRLAVDPEQVLLDPEIFRSARHSLAFKPSADMFASASHHQLPRYYSKDPCDTTSAGVDAFQFSWQLETAPYFNPPWSLIPEVLAKISAEGVRGMLVIPRLAGAPWCPPFWLSA